MTRGIGRVLVPLDAASDNPTAIDTAARLAARWRVPLHGVFIEDEELIGLAGLPFARQATLAAGLEELTPRHVEAQLRAFAERAREELAAAAMAHRVEWSFDIVRGPLAAVLGGGEHDFVVASAATRPVCGHFRIASRWLSLIATGARPFLLARRKWDGGGSVIAALRRRDPAAARTLDIAAEIAGFGNGRLAVLLDPGLAGSVEAAAWIAALVEGRRLRLQTEFTAIEPVALAQRIGEHDCRLLVLQAGGEAAPRELRDLVAHLSCDVLLTR